ncbi:MAG: patatin-like phospholipase family protein [Pseudomonadota bacterium]
MFRFVIPLALAASSLFGCQSISPQPPSVVTKSAVIAPVELPKPIIKAPPKIALALGGGAARGFSHIGVIKALEAQGIYPDIIVGTSAGSVVGALYAGGFNGFELQKLAIQLDESALSDWSLPDRGFFKGEGLQNFINRTLSKRPIEKLKRPFAAIATDLQSGEMVAFRRGDTGIAVRASASVPGVFHPVSINGRDYVDSGLTSPVPVKTARAMGADIVIAVDISARPQFGKTAGSLDVLLQTFCIMVQSISAYELPGADVVLRPDNGPMAAADFQSRHLAILEGERQVAEKLPRIREKIAQFMAR